MDKDTSIKGINTTLVLKLSFLQSGIPFQCFLQASVVSMPTPLNMEITFDPEVEFKLSVLYHQLFSVDIIDYTDILKE